MKSNRIDKNNLIRYKWESGVYRLKEMIELVKKEKITQQQFFDITRYNYNGVVKEST